MLQRHQRFLGRAGRPDRITTDNSRSCFAEMFDEDLQPSSNGGIDGCIEPQFRRECDTQISQIDVTAFNAGGIAITGIGACHRFECERCIGDVSRDGRDHGYVEKRLGEPGTIWNGAIRWLEADHADMGRRAAAGAAGVRADRQRYKVRCDGRCRPARRTTGRQIPIKGMPCGPEQRRGCHALAGEFRRGAHAHNDSSRLFQPLDRDGVTRCHKVGKKPGSLRDTPAVNPDIVFDDDRDSGERHMLTELQAVIDHGRFRK
jgi:hypothetical protein